MPATLPPPPPPDPDSSRVWELCAIFVVAPLIVGLVSRFEVHTDNDVGRSLAKGAIYLLLPCLFGVLLLVLTHATWAAWASFSLEALLLGLLGIADLFVEHRITPRLVLVVVALAYSLARTLSLARVRSSRSSPT
jgi:hypothetical protein